MSSINPNNIDGTYPIAGQDNDSQGFRNNFTEIINNFKFAAAELTDLQNNAVLKSPLSGGTVDANFNNLNYQPLVAGQIREFVETKNDLGTQSGTITVDWTSGHFQTLTTSGPVSISFQTSWPTSGVFTKLRLQVTVSSVADTLTLNTGGTITYVNLSNIQGANGQVITFPATGVYVFEFTTYDSGATITVQDILRNVDTVGDYAVTGNLTTSGGRIDAGYQYSAATTSFSVTTGVSISRVIFDPAGTLATGAVTLPAGNVDAKTVTISSTQTITALTVNGNSGTTVVGGSNPYTLSAGTGITFFFHASENKWYKIG